MKTTPLLMLLGTVLVLAVLAGGFIFVFPSAFRVSEQRESAQPNPVGSPGNPGDGESRGELVDLEGRPRPSRDAMEILPDPGDSAPDARGLPVDVPQSSAGLVGRCVDGQGAPLEDVEVLDRRGTTLARSRKDGSFALEIDAEDWRVAARRFAFRRSGLGQRKIQVSLRAEEVVDMGAVILELGASISGSTVDSDGLGQAGISLSMEDTSTVSNASRFQGPWNPTNESETSGDGTFTIADVAPGEARLWYGGGDWIWTSTDLMDLAPGENLDLGALELVALEPEDTIELTVVDPEGIPIPGARVSYSYNTSGRSGTGTAGVTDEQGQLTHFTDPRTTYTFTANDPEKRYRSTIARDVDPGTRDLVMQLGERKVLVVRVVNEHGDALETFNVSFHSRLGSGSLLSQDDAIQAGVVELSLPQENFSLTVSAPGHASEEIPDLDPETVEAELRVVLDALPGIHGRVLANGLPVPGAEVTLHGMVDAQESLTVNGFPCVTERQRQGSDKSDQEGKYDLTLRETGTWVLRVEAVGYAPAILEPTYYVASMGATNVDIELGAGGSIVGRVIAASSKDRNAQIVGFSRGDGYAFTLRTDANGEYSVQGLTPGDWQVLLRDEEVRPNNTTSSMSSSARDEGIPWDCQVFEGQVTNFDLDLRELHRVTLSGTFHMGSISTRGWRVSINPQFGSAGTPTQTTVQSGDSYELKARKSGKYTVSVSGEMQDTFVRAQASTTLEEGENTLSLDVPSGSLRVTASTDQFGPDSEIYVDSDAHAPWSVIAGIRLDQGGTSSLEGFPVGPATIRYTTSAGVSGSKQVNIVEGGTAETYLP